MVPAVAFNKRTRENFYVIIPAHNEAAHIGAVLERTRKLVAPKKIIVVDDGSRDNTAQEAKKHNVTVLRQVINVGKGSALRTGSIYACGKGAESLIYIDGDGQHDPEDLPRILTALKGNEIVFTFRERKSNNMPLVKKIGNDLIDVLMSVLFHIEVQDTQCGYKAMTRAAYEKMKLISNDYSIESEMVAKTGKYKLKFAQVPIKTIYADRYKGTTIFDGINIVMKMLWWKIAR